ncbi:MAG TPA: acetyltransferase [Rhodothermales bacterium]|nr:acetyltransferase [Rhodothermales bacterium]
MKDEQRELAEAVREACMQTLISAYEEAGMSGLCAEGRIEYALGALRGLDLEEFLRADSSAGLKGRGAETDGTATG